MKIQCTDCEMYQTNQCDDCLVTALLHPPADTVEITDDLDPPLQALAGAGLIPILRFRPKPDERTPRDDEGVNRAS
ncbi:MAG: hypothetical protein M3290_04005 [Actinomycetota bacterium]|nr:hypothetical protein [Actinomycetota bacterium]